MPTSLDKPLSGPVAQDAGHCESGSGVDGSQSDVVGRGHMDGEGVELTLARVPGERAHG